MIFSVYLYKLNYMFILSKSCILHWDYNNVVILNNQITLFAKNCILNVILNASML